MEKGPKAQNWSYRDRDRRRSAAIQPSKSLVIRDNKFTNDNEHQTIFVRNLSDGPAQLSGNIADGQGRPAARTRASAAGHAARYASIVTVSVRHRATSSQSGVTPRPGPSGARTRPPHTGMRGVISSSGHVLQPEIDGPADRLQRGGQMQVHRRADADLEGAVDGKIKASSGVTAARSTMACGPPHITTSASSTSTQG